MAKDRMGVPKKSAEPGRGLGGPIFAVLVGLIVGAALVFGFFALRNTGALDEWIEEYPALKFLDDEPPEPAK